MLKSSYYANNNTKIRVITTTKRPKLRIEYFLYVIILQMTMQDKTDEKRVEKKNKNVTAREAEVTLLLPHFGSSFNRIGC